MEMLKEVELIRDQTRGELTGAATRMRSVQEALADQWMRVRKVEEGTTNTAAGAATDQKKTQDMMENMLRIMKKQRRKKLRTGGGRTRMLITLCDK